MFGVLTKQIMADRFLEESKHLLELERGRDSIPAVQALLLMYTTTTCLGRDRTARMHRVAAFEMLNRLELEKRFASLSESDPSEARERQVISRALWGVFVLER